MIDLGLEIQTTALTGVFGVSVSFSSDSSESESIDSTQPALSDSSNPEGTDSMNEYFSLVLELNRIMLLLTSIIFGGVWYFYSLSVALNYLLGACIGFVYMRMLAKNVEELGQSRQGIGKARLALIVGVLIVSTRVDQLEFLPIFLGFLTYKAALLVYTIRVVSTS
ncbi:MAG: ATP synthase subunit I [Prochlorotrichaceae cyanobacterium]|jgi:ATP synthase protein I